jgi:hypothetical protein
MLIGVALIVAIATIREEVGFRRRGYRVRVLGKRGYAYEELARAEEEAQDADRHLLPFSCARGRHLEPEIPSEDRWDNQVPEWARGRRAEIATRIKERLLQLERRFQRWLIGAAADPPEDSPRDEEMD